MATSRQFRVPREQYLGLAKLLQLPETTVQELIAALRDTRPTLPRREFVARITSTVDTDPTELDAILDVLLALYWLRMDLAMSLSDFVDAVTQAMVATNQPELQPTDTWSARLSSLLQFEDTVGTIAKGAYLAAQYEHSVHDVEIFTDLRPIFRADLEAQPAAAIVTHNLKITYHEGSELREFYVALGPRGMRHLRNVVARADRKAKRLLSLLESASLPVLGEEPE